jgi:hypothetical protein
MKIPISGQVLIKNKHLWVSGLSVEISLLNETFDYVLSPTFKKSLEICTDSPFRIQVKVFKNVTQETSKQKWSQMLKDIKKLIQNQLESINKKGRQVKV